MYKVEVHNDVVVDKVYLKNPHREHRSVRLQVVHPSGIYRSTDPKTNKMLYMHTYRAIAVVNDRCFSVKSFIDNKGPDFIPEREDFVDLTWIEEDPWTSWKSEIRKLFYRWWFAGRGYKSTN